MLQAGSKQILFGGGLHQSPQERLSAVENMLILTSHKGATKVIGSNVSKFGIAGKPASLSYIVIGDTLAIHPNKFMQVMNAAADKIEQTIHDRITIVHCFAGINRSTTSILAIISSHGSRFGITSDP